MHKRVTVYVPVQNLHNLIIKGSSYVRSNGNLASNNLLVTVSGASKIEINNIGHILFAADEGIDILIHKWQTTQNLR